MGHERRHCPGRGITGSDRERRAPGAHRSQERQGRQEEGQKEEETGATHARASRHPVWYERRSSRKLLRQDLG